MFSVVVAQRMALSPVGSNVMVMVRDDRRGAVTTLRG
jgi:hypothetical protein